MRWQLLPQLQNKHKHYHHVVSRLLHISKPQILQQRILNTCNTINKNWNPIQNHFTSSSSSSSQVNNNKHSETTTTNPKTQTTKHYWNEEWKRLNLTTTKITESNNDNDIDNHIITNLLFVQTGFGIDQHGNRMTDGATKAAIRAVRNAIEFNSIPGVIECVPGGRKEMLIQVILGVPPTTSSGQQNSEENKENKKAADLKPMYVDLDQVAKVFPYGKLLPIQVTIGGLSFPTGRIVHELGDVDDMAICVAAAVSIGYDNKQRQSQQQQRNVENSKFHHKTYSTKDGH
jgi:hypothetical protein